MREKRFRFFSVAGWLFFLLTGISFAQPLSLPQPGAYQGNEAISGQPLSLPQPDAYQGNEAISGQPLSLPQPDAYQGNDAISGQPLSLPQPGVYQGNEAISGWLMSEKYDGIRGYWTGTMLVTRAGNRIHAPKWFTRNFPPFALDGEVWRKRNDFSFVQNTVQDTVPSDDWAELTYQIFDVPTAPGDFLSRLETARKWFDAHPAPHVKIIPQQICTGPAHLAAFLESVVAGGGEGVVLRHPTLAPHAGRSPYLLKVKPFSQMEGVVIGHTPGKGKFSGMTGSLVVRLEDGVTFRLGTGLTLSQRRHPPPVGAVVTFKYQGLTKNGIPRFASFLREGR